jgi:hypothetical protein
MEISHSHAELICAYDGVNGVNIGFFVYFCFGLFFSVSVHEFSPHSVLSFLGLPPFMYAIFNSESTS